MGERVETGGLMKFDYSKREVKKLGEKEKKDIEKGYEEYYERKRRVKRRKFFIVVLIVIVILAGLLAIVL